MNLARVSNNGQITVQNTSITAIQEAQTALSIVNTPKMKYWLM